MKDLENSNNLILEKELLCRRKISYIYKRLEAINNIALEDNNYLATSDRYISIIESLAINLLIIPWDRDFKSREVTNSARRIHLDYFINNEYLDFILSRKICPWMGKPGTLLAELLLSENLNSYLSIHQLLDRCVNQALVRNNLQWFINRKLDEDLEDTIYIKIQEILEPLRTEVNFINALSKWTKELDCIDISNGLDLVTITLREIKAILISNGYQYIEEQDSQALLFLEHSYTLGQVISELIDKRRTISIGIDTPTNEKERLLKAFIELVSPNKDRLIIQLIVDKITKLFIPGGIDYFLVVMSAIYLSRALSLAIYSSNISKIKRNLYLAGYLLRMSNVRSLNILGNNCCYSSGLEDKEPIRIKL